jgi:guanylate kinase
MNYAEKFDAIVLNDDIQKAFDESQRLVTGFLLSS